MPGPRILLSNYVARVISRGPGILSSFSHPSWVVSLVLQNLIGGPWSSYGHVKSVFLVLKAFFILAPASAGRIGVFHAVSYRGSHSKGWSEWSFSFVPGFVAKTQDPSFLTPRFAGFTVPAQPITRQSQWETVMSCAGSQVLPGPLCCTSSAMQAVPFCRRVKHKGVVEDHCLLLAPDAVVTGIPALGYGTVCLCPLSSVHSCCHSVSSLKRTLLSSWWEGEYVALAHILAVLLLRGSCPLVPRRLPPGLCGGSAGPFFTRACSPRHISAY